MAGSWSDLSFVKRSNERLTIFQLLDEPKTPTELKRESKLHISNVSRTLAGLVKRGLVECLTPREVRGRYYKKSRKGARLAAILSSRR